MVEIEHLERFSDAWRVLGRMGVVDTVFNHITEAHEDGGGMVLLMNPADRLATELTPEKVCIVPLQSQLGPNDAERFGVNADGIQLHAAIHQARRRTGIAIHVHSPYSIAVGCTKDGLLPLTQTAMEFVGNLVLVDYDGLFRNGQLSGSILELAERGGVALLRHHGVLVVADSLAEAVYLTYYLEEACRLQVLTLSQGKELTIPPHDVIAIAGQQLGGDRVKVAELMFAALRRQIQHQ